MKVCKHKKLRGMYHYAFAEDSEGKEYLVKVCERCGGVVNFRKI